MNMYAKKVADIIAAIEEIQASGNPMTREEIFSSAALQGTYNANPGNQHRSTVRQMI